MMGAWGRGWDRLVLLVSIFICIAAAFAVSNAYPASVVSTGSLFNATPAYVWLNWSNGYRHNVSIGVNTSIASHTNITVNITINTTHTGIRANYSQRSYYFFGKYVDGCFSSLGIARDSPIAVLNATSGTASSVTRNMTGNMTDIMALLYNVICPPGRYFGWVRMYNNTLENLSVYVTVDVPINTSNTLDDNVSFAARFNGTFPNRSRTYHSYYFNTSVLPNLTSVRINLTWNQGNGNNLDLFLFNDSGNLKARSTGFKCNESVYYSWLPANKMWQIRIYGNLSSSQAYHGLIVFTKLNATYMKNGRRINTLNMGAVNTMHNSTNNNITLTNMGNLSFAPVSASSHLYREMLVSGNGSRNVTFILPSFAQKLVVTLNYSSASRVNYTLRLYNQNRRLMNVSRGNTKNQNVTGSERYEWLEVGQANITQGIWKVNVTARNQSLSTPYKLSIACWVDSSKWIRMNWTSLNMARMGQANSTKYMRFNFTPPREAIDGIYKGYIVFRTSPGGVLRLPVWANYTAPVLVVNNTFRNATMFAEYNNNMNKTMRFNITVRNNGSTDMTFGQSRDSSGRISLGSSIAAFTYRKPAVLRPGETFGMEVTIRVNTSNTTGTGLHMGWIYLNATGARPYSYFNVTFKLNISSSLRLLVNDVTDKGLAGDRMIEIYNKSRNISVDVNVQYLNRTEVLGLPIGNFSIWLTERNTSYTIPASGYLPIASNVSGSLYTGGRYLISATVPGNKSGGRYYVNVSVNHLRHGIVYTGTGRYNYISIKRPGLYLSPVSSTSLSVNEGKYTYFNLSVRNYGVIPVSAGRINLDGSADSDCDYLTIEAATGQSSSYSDTSGNAFTGMTLNGNGTTAWYRWRLTAANVTSGLVCTMRINASSPLLNNKTVSVTISNVNSGTSTTDTAGGAGGGDGDVYSYELSITSYPSVVQAFLGTTNVTNITVKNNGNITVATKVAVSLAGISTSIFPESQSIPPATSKQYQVTFTVSNSTTLGDHTGTFKAYIALMTDQYDTKQFTFRVMSTAKRQVEINASYLNRSAEFQALLLNFTGIKSSGLIPASNLSSVEILVNETRQTLESIRSAIEDGDYATAESLLSGMASALSRIKSRLTELSAQKNVVAGVAMSGIWVWAVIGIIIAAAAGLFVYMIMPPSHGYHAKMGFRPMKEQKSGKIKKALSSLKDKLKRKKHHGFSYSK